MKKVIFIFVMIVNFAYAQKQNNIWYFGGKAGIDFNSSLTTALTDSEIYQNEGCATISDTTGALLFYTDGVSVWNANHQQMPNGFGLLGHSSATQSALIVPKPLDCKTYYIFTVPSQDSITPLSYSIVDMTLNGGLGDIISKNNFLSTPVTERLTGTLKSNGIDYWVVSQKFNSNEFLVFSVTSLGVNTTPIVSSSGPKITSIIDVLGYMKISPNGSKLCYASLYGNGPAQLFDFDNTSGMVSNNMALYNYGGYGVEFSPDSKMLYIATVNAPFIIKQYDLVTNSEIEIVNQLIFNGSAQYGGALQLGTDNKIYINRLTKGFLGVIDQPNSLGILCNYIDSAVYLGGKVCFSGLPNCIKKFSSCSTETSTTSPIVFNSNENSITVFPNPSEGEAKIRLNYFLNDFMVKVFNVAGQKVFEKTSVSGILFDIDITKQPAGIYFIEVLSDTNVFKQTMIKQ